MPIVRSGWELHIQRQSQQTRSPRVRTVGTYAIYHDGQARTGLAGISVESKGPGDNKVQGNGRRIEAGRYPIATHSGQHYVTIGYLISDDSDQTPKPGLELLHTQNRVGILVHPGHGFLASIGCINLSAPLGDGPSTFRSWTAGTGLSRLSTTCALSPARRSPITMAIRSRMPGW